jgi:acetoin utilization deacetylase AcuC-like enzyme
LLNNVAVAAAHARATYAERVAIVDWDVHHGNGTQEIFYRDPSVLYVSLHQAPFYPGTGYADETGDGEGEGFTVNIPLRSGADDGVYAAAFERIVAPVIEQFAPDLVLVSAGFDAHADDPLAGMRLRPEAYARMTAWLTRALGERAATRVALLLEGGYDLQAITTSLRAAVEALDATTLESPAPLDLPDVSLDPSFEPDLLRAERSASRAWVLG